MKYDEENILTGDTAWDLFGDDDPVKDEKKDSPEEDNPEDEKKNKPTENKEVDAEDLFSSESGGGDKEETEEGTESEEHKGSSPENFYSSIAQALVDEGTFQFLDKEAIEGVANADDFEGLFQKEIEARLDDTQKRINDALNNGVQPSEIQRYESSIKYLDTIKDENIDDESEKGETLRKQLIYTDAIQRGMSKERAQKEVEKSFKAGTDLDDAKDALESCKEFTKKSYNDLLNNAKEETKKQEKEQKERAEKLRKSMLETDSFYDGLKVDKATRQKAYDSVMKPSHRTEDGEVLTAVQKYQQDNPEDFIMNIGLLFTLTDGFKNLDKLVVDKVNKEKKSTMRKLEKVLNTTRRNSDGSLNLAIGGDKDSSFSGWRIDI